MFAPSLFKICTEIQVKSNNQRKTMDAQEIVSEKYHFQFIKSEEIFPSLVD